MKELMEFRILNWNVAGAKYLGQPKKERLAFRQRLNEKLNELVADSRPHVVTLQEIVQYQEGKNREDIVDPPRGYTYHPFVLIDTENLSIGAKWNKLERDGKWRKGRYFAQGNGFLFRTDLPHQPVWALPKDGRHKPRVKRPNYVEKVGL